MKEYNDLKSRDLRDTEVGSRVKVFSTKVYHVSVAILTIYLIAIVIFSIVYLSYSGLGGYGVLIFFITAALVGLAFYIAYITLYQSFILNYSMGVLVQDVNQLKKQLVEKKVIDNYDKENGVKKSLKCSACGASISEDAKKCPSCGAEFE